jgi:hypothetical protein
MRVLIVSLTAVFLLSGCMSKSKPWTPSSSSVKTSLSEASSTCMREANMAAASARRDKLASQSSGGGFTAGLANSLSATIAEKSARKNTMKYCMRAQGFTND